MYMFSFPSSQIQLAASSRAKIFTCNSIHSYPYTRSV